jgi:hypothetical protein
MRHALSIIAITALVTLGSGVTRDRALAQTAAPPTPASSPMPSPTAIPVEIFRAAMKRIRSYSEPDYIDGITTWHVAAAPRRGEHLPPYTYDVRERITLRTSDRIERVRGTITSRQSGEYETAIAPAFFGPDAWAVHGVVRHRDDRIVMQPDIPPNLKTIAAVVSYEKLYYTISLAGIDTLTNGHRAYHLLFAPLTDPKVHNLRQMWVDVASSDIWKAVTTGQYALPEFGPGPAVLEQMFDNVRGHWLVQRAAWSYEPPHSPYSFQFEMQYDQMTFPKAIPAAFFLR